MKQIISVVSGKGGVGKSTVAVNLAVSLARTGAKVALVDADFYGPSVPILMGGGAIEGDEQGRIIPPEKYGVKYVSIGFFLGEPDTPVIWRGPMLHKGLKQLFEDVNWGPVDYCVVDMPPGTGDTQLSLSQIVRVTGAVVVTTPQEVAMADVRKAINMLRKVDIHVFGIIENMAGFVAPDGQRHDIFGSGGGGLMAKKYDVPLLASIPIDLKIREGGDLGTPVACSDNLAAGKTFAAVALKLIDILATKQKNSPSLKIIS